MSEDEFQVLVGSQKLEFDIIYRVGTPEVWYRATGTSTYETVGAGSIALTDSEFAALVAADGLQLGIIYRVGTPEVWYRATGVDTYTPVSAGADYVDVPVPGADDYTIEV